MSRAIDADNGDFDDGLYSTVRYVKLLTFAQAAGHKKKRKKKKRHKRGKKCQRKK